MSEQRCSQCEALITEVECLECIWHTRHQNSGGIPPSAAPTGLHCRKGHEMTEDNTRYETRPKCIARVCRTCRNQRIAKSRANKKAAALEGAQ